ncbi:MAG TPA: amino acid adenylation domain-containing protein [Puia sp.]|jgi:amino acid adenylation domain-containing protein|nr:amino acid adenylation domain-containing protein [Puia sp.]
MLLLSGEPFETKPDYWKNKLQLPSLELPASYARPVLKYYKGDTICFTIDKELSRQLTLLCSQQDANIYMVLLAAFKVLLYRSGNSDKISVGSLLPVRIENKINEAIDFFVKPVALHSAMDGNMSFSTFLKQLKTFILEDAVNQEKQDEGALDASTRSPQENLEYTLKYMFILHDESGPVFDPGFMKLFRNASIKPELILIMAQTQTGLQGTISYSPESYQKEAIIQTINHYNELLDSIVRTPQQKIGVLGLLTEAEQKALLSDFNNTLAVYPEHKTLVDIFHEQVLKTPDHIALQMKDQTLSYIELNRQSNRLANYLISQGVEQGDNVGLLIGRGFDMITAMYAILKSGAAYVPIDPDYPLDRQQYILNQSAVKLVLADDDYLLKNFIGTGQFMNIHAIDLNEYSPEDLPIKIEGSQLAYTIYTSGSTGRPKGVMIEHHSVVNLIQWVNMRFNVGPGDRLLFITSMCFDLSVYDIFGILSAGGTLVIALKNEVQNMKKLQEMLQAYAITFWDSVPTTMDNLIRELETSHRPYSQYALKTVFLSGDWVAVNLPQRINKYFPSASVISLGGATETTVWSNFYPVEKKLEGCTSIPYGKPLQNNFFYILNEQLQPVPQGVAGELYIGGAGVARGYANEPEKTSRAFMKDPFNCSAGGRMYRTGDIGKMLDDMNMEFIGRKDDQVKIRGLRVELGEIESVLNQSGLIRQAVVLAKNDREGKKSLIGYVVTNASFHREAVISHLKNKLPEYMIPTVWVKLDSFPLGTNGKIDRQALPEVEAPDPSNEQHAAPRSDLEKTFSSIWQEVLGRKKIGIRDNFFELGGDSLLAVQIMTKIENETGKKIPLPFFFKFPTIEQQVACILKNQSDKPWKSLAPIKSSGSKKPLFKRIQFHLQEKLLRKNIQKK